MEQVNPWLSLVALLGAVIPAVLLYRSTRKDTDRNGEGGFRDDLLQRIDQQDQRIKLLESRIEERDAKIAELQTKIGQMQVDLRHQQDVNADQAAHLTVLTDWGRDVIDTGRVPTSLPHWRQAQ